MKQFLAVLVGALILATAPVAWSKKRTRAPDYPPYEPPQLDVMPFEPPPTSAPSTEAPLSPNLSSTENTDAPATTPETPVETEVAAPSEPLASPTETGVPDLQLTEPPVVESAPTEPAPVQVETPAEPAPTEQVQQPEQVPDLQVVEPPVQEAQPPHTEEAVDIPVAKMPPISKHYKVWIWQESGDSLSRIAQKVYGDKTKWKLIYLANKDVIKDPNRIYPKQKLKIPPADWQPY